MREKIDLSQVESTFYELQNRPKIIEVPQMKFLKIFGSMGYLSEEFFSDLKFIYYLAVQMKFLKFSKKCPKEYYDFRLMPIEVVIPMTFKKEKYYEILIRQPDFMTFSLFKDSLDDLKIRLPRLDQKNASKKVQFIEVKEGTCIQLVHFSNRCLLESLKKGKQFLQLKHEKLQIKEASYFHQILYHDLRKNQTIQAPTLIRMPLQLNKNL